MKPRKKLRDYLLVTIIPLTLIPMIGMGFFTLYTLKQSIHQEILRRARPEISTLVRNLESMLRQAEADALSAGANEDLKISILAKDKDVENAFLGAILNQSHFNEISLYNKKGLQIFNKTQNAEKRWKEFLINLSPRGSDQRKPATQTRIPFPFKKAEIFSNNGNQELRKGFLNAIRQKGFWWTYTQNQLSNHGLIFHYFHRIIDKKKNFVGVFHGKLEFNQSILGVLASLQDLDVSLLNMQGKVLSSSNPELKTFLEKNSDSWNFKNNSWETEFAKQPYTFFFSKLNIESNEEPIWINIGLSQHSLTLLQKRIFLSIIGLGIIIAAIVLLLTVALAERITQPISRLVNAVDAMKEGQWVQPVEEDSATELGYLVQRFNDMANSVQATKRTLETKLEELAQAHGVLQNTQDQLVHSAKMSSLGQLVAGVAHELNNPIAFIYSNVFQLREYLDDLEKLDGIIKGNLENLDEATRQKAVADLKKIDWDFIRKDMVDIIQSCLEGSIRVKDIVLGLKNFSRLDKGQLDDCDVNLCLKDTTKLLGSQLKNKIELSWDLCSDGIIKANKSQLNQVFVNIIANASQAIESNGEIKISSVKDKNYLIIKIADNGRGISKEHIDKIFDPFFTTKKVGEGTGLGLSIVYGIIQRHGGQLDVKSLTEPDPKHGTEFTIKLPINGPAHDDSDGEMSQAS